MQAKITQDTQQKTEVRILNLICHLEILPNVFISDWQNIFFNNKGSENKNQ